MVKNIVYNINFDHKDAAEKIRVLEEEMRQFGEYHKANLRELEIKIKTNIDKEASIAELNRYKTEIEGILKKFQADPKLFDYQRVKFLNRELDKTNSILANASGRKNLDETAKSISGIEKGALEAGIRLKTMFGIGALVGIGLALIRSYFKEIREGILKAAENNDVLKNKMETVHLQFKNMFVDLGIWLLPLVDQLTNVANFFMNMHGGSIDQLPKEQLEAYYAKIEARMTTLKQWLDVYKQYSAQVKPTADEQKKYKEYTKDLKELEIQYQRIDFRLTAMREKEDLLAEKRERSLAGLKKAYGEAEKALSNLEKVQNKTIGDRLFDQLKSEMTGVIGAFAKLGDSIAAISDKNTGLDATRDKISKLQRELEKLKKLGDTGTQKQRDARSKSISEKSGELNELSDSMDNMMASAVSAYALVAKVIADTALNFWNSFDSTMKRMENSVYDQNTKNYIAIEDASSDALKSLYNEIPIVGGLLAKRVDQMWDTNSEKRDRYLKELSDSMDKFNHDMATGVNISTQAQIDFYVQYLYRQKQIGADQKDIWATEEKILELKKKQKEEMEQQAELAKEIMNLQSGLYGRSASDRVEYYRGRIAAAEKQLAASQSMEMRTLDSNLIANLQQQIAVLTMYRDEFQRRVDNAIRWLTPEWQYQQWDSDIRLAQSMIDNLTSLLSAEYSRVNDYNNQITADILEQQKILEEARLQIELLTGDILRYEKEYFEHQLAMDTKSTDEEKNKKRIKYYTEYLERMKEVNAEYDRLTALKESELNTEKEALKTARDAGDDDAAADAEEKIDALQEQLKTIDEERFAIGDIWAMEEKIVELRKAGTREIEKQISLLRDSGLFDPENLFDVQDLISMMKRQNMSPSEILAGTSDAGVGGGTLSRAGVRNVILNGNIYSNLYSASENTAAGRVVSLLKKKIGAL